MEILTMILPYLTGGGGGLLAGKMSPNLSLGTVGNIIAGLLGGGIGSQVLGMLGMGVGPETGMDLTSILGNVASGGIGGGGLMFVIGMVKKLISK